MVVHKAGRLPAPNNGQRATDNGQTSKKKGRPKGWDGLNFAKLGTTPASGRRQTTDNGPLTTDKQAKRKAVPKAGTA